MIIDGLDHQAAKSRPAEYLLCHDRAAEHERDHGTQYGNNRNQGVSQTVNDHDSRLDQALCTGSADVILIEDFHHASSCLAENASDIKNS